MTLITPVWLLVTVIAGTVGLPKNSDFRAAQEHVRSVMLDARHASNTRGRYFFITRQPYAETDVCVKGCMSRVSGLRARAAAAEPPPNYAAEAYCCLMLLACAEALPN
jgi:hypothetical protein